MEPLTDENFIVFCAKVYDNPSFYSTDEFLEDLNRLRSIKKILSKYKENGELKERLLLNHFITLHNCFGIHLARILFLKLESQFSMIKPFLIMLNALPSVIQKVGAHEAIYTDEISMDNEIIIRLRKINNG